MHLILLRLSIVTVLLCCIAACSSSDPSKEPIATVPPSTATPPALSSQPAPTLPSATQAPVTNVPGPVPTVAGQPSPAPSLPAAPAVPINLSERLQRIVSLSDAGRLATTLPGISVQVDLPATGATSLSGTTDGKLLVEVRLRPGDDGRAVQALGQVLNSSPQFASLTLAIEPSRLRDLAALPAVQAAREVIRPSTN